MVAIGGGGGGRIFAKHYDQSELVVNAIFVVKIQARASVPLTAQGSCAIVSGTAEAVSSSQANLEHRPYPCTEPPSTNAMSVASLCKDSCRCTRARAHVRMMARRAMLAEAPTRQVESDLSASGVQVHEARRRPDDDDQAQGRPAAKHTLQTLFFLLFLPCACRHASPPTFCLFPLSLQICD